MALTPLSWAGLTVLSKPLRLRYHPPVLATYATAIGVLFMGKPVGWPLLVGGALILGGMRLVLAPERAAHE